MRKNLVSRAYDQINQFSGGTLEILKRTMNSLSRERAGQAAAGLAYYAFFSLFPLLLLLVVGSSFFFESDQASQQVVEFISQALPVSTTLLERNIAQVLELRGPVSAIGLISLLWSATSVFSALAHNINLAWPKSKERNFFHKRLMGLLMTSALLALFGLSVTVSSLNTLLSAWRIAIFGSVSETNLWEILSQISSWILILLMFLALYRWVPTEDVGWKPAVWGALAATFLWQIATTAFTWFLRAGLGSYDLVYGSLAAVVALLILIYINAWVALFGAHLCAAIMGEQ